MYPGNPLTLNGVEDPMGSPASPLMDTSAAKLSKKGQNTNPGRSPNLFGATSAARRGAHAAAAHEVLERTEQKQQ